MVAVTMRLIMKDDANGIAYYQCSPVNDREATFRLGLNLTRHEIISLSQREMNLCISNAVLKLYEIFERKQRIPERAIAMWSNKGRAQRDSVVTIVFSQNND
jgi:hypothetical protein